MNERESRWEKAIESDAGYSSTVFMLPTKQLLRNTKIGNARVYDG